MTSKLKKRAEAIIPTDWGEFNMIAFADHQEDRMPHLCLIHEPFDEDAVLLVRIHSECITGDLFHSQRCDCGQQLDQALKLIAEEGGVLVYLRQEGRGIGIINKLHAYNKQDEGLDTIEANEALGFHADERNYDVAVEILNHFKIKRVKLLTNNPEKIDAFQGSGIEIINRVPLVVAPNKINEKYLKTKQQSLGHLFKL